MIAVIKTGGKQYVVSPGDKIKIEKINKKEGQEVTFDQVLLMENGRKLEIGNPLVKKAKVIVKVTKQGKSKKVIVFKAGKRYRKKKGHRQPFTEVKIMKIESSK